MIIFCYNWFLTKAIIANWLQAILLQQCNISKIIGKITFHQIMYLSTGIIRPLDYHVRTTLKPYLPGEGLSGTNYLAGLTPSLVIITLLMLPSLL
ncbi:hypothetical protein ABID99_000376 [Mucilaginibacter sp. OAE612]